MEHGDGVATALARLEEVLVSRREICPRRKFSCKLQQEEVDCNNNNNS